MRLRPRGIALVTVLLMLTILVIIVVALLCALRGENFLTLGYAQRTAALYVAEAGVAICQANLENDNTWQTDLVNQVMPGGQGTFTVRFSDGTSVNNLTGASSVDGPRGPSTVLPGTADITISARVGIITRTLEVIVGNVGLIQPPYPLMAGGTINMLGNVNVSGVQAAGNPNGSPAGIFSNDAANQANIITWSPINAGDKATVTGQVATVSNNANAVNMSGATVSQGIKTGVQPQNLPPVDIASLISSKSTSPKPVINAVGATQLPMGDYYYNGNLSMNGDLQLDGANLYVTGKLTINGTIKGSGSVFVASSTTFQGNSSVTAGGDGQQIALYSHGDVTLSGFNGTAWLTAFTAANGLSTQWSEIQNTFAAMQSYMTQYGGSPQGYFWNGSPFDKMGDGMRSGGGNTPTITTPNSPILDIENAVAAQPPSPTQQFILNQLKSWVYDDGSSSMAGMFRAHSGGSVPWIPGTPPMEPYAPITPAQGPDWWNSIDGMVNNGATDGIVDGVNDAEAFQYIGMLANVIGQYDPNHIGSAYFRGLVYTDGNFNAVNEVSIMGALVAGKNLNLSDGTDVTFVNQFFRVPSPGLNKMAVKAWLGR